MPSMFESLKRMLKGEPVFRPGEDTNEPTHKSDNAAKTPASAPTDGPTPVPAKPAGPKVIPVAVVKRIENRVSGNNLDVDLTIQNNSQANVFLDKIMFLGRTKELDYNLNPGQEREFISVYRGPAFNNSSYNKCELWYRDDSGDYFSAVHNIDFDLQRDGTYWPIRAEFLPPVKDI